MSRPRTVNDGHALDRLILVGNESTDPRVRGAVLAFLKSGMGPAIPARPWLSVTETADLLGVSERTVRDHANAGKLRSKRVGRRLLIHVTEVTGTVRSRAETGLGDDGPDPHDDRT